MLFLWACGDTSMLEAWPSPHATWCDPNANGLVITEFLANPAGPDRGREWFEMFNAGEQNICLDRAELQIGPSWMPHTRVLQGAGCLAPKTFVVAGDGNISDGVINISYASRRHDGPTLEMPNDEGIIVVRCQKRMMAQVRYGPNQTIAAPLAARTQTRVPHDAQDEDASSVWCHAQGRPYDGLNQGSPGGPNKACHLCVDADGQERAQILATPLTVDVVAALADPVGPDFGHEWLAFDALGDDGVDLANMSIVGHSAGHKSRAWQLVSPDCAHVPAHTTARVMVNRARTSAPKLCDWQLDDAHNDIFCSLKEDRSSLDDAPVVPHAFFVGPTLPNYAMSLTFSQDNRGIVTVVLPDAKVGVPSRPGVH